MIIQHKEASEKVNYDLAISFGLYRQQLMNSGFAYAIARTFVNGTEAKKIQQQENAQWCAFGTNGVVVAIEDTDFICIQLGDLYPDAFQKRLQFHCDRLRLMYGEKQS